MDQNSKEFKKLQKTWYKKLKDTGFNDLETESGLSKQNVGTYFYNVYHPDRFEFQAEYYRRVGYFLHTHKFKNTFERRIWELYAEGVTIRETVRILTDAKIRTYKREVHEIRQALTKLMLEAIKAGENG